MPELNQPIDTYPNEGDVYNYNGQNYEVIGEVDPSSFLCLGPVGWVPAIAFKDFLNEEAGETSSELRYVMPLDQFNYYFGPGPVDEDNPPEINNELPTPTRPVDPNYGVEAPEAEPKG